MMSIMQCVTENKERENNCMDCGHKTRECVCIDEIYGDEQQPEQYECDRDVLDIPEEQPPVAQRPVIPNQLYFGNVDGLTHPGGWPHLSAGAVREERAPKSGNRVRRNRKPLAVNVVEVQVDKPKATWKKMGSTLADFIVVQRATASEAAIETASEAGDDAWTTVTKRGSDKRSDDKRSDDKRSGDKRSGDKRSDERRGSMEHQHRSKAFETFGDRHKIAQCLQKSRMCNNLTTCKFGANCKFAHNRSELVLGRCVFGAGCRKFKVCKFHHSDVETQEEAKNRIFNKPQIDVVAKLPARCAPCAPSCAPQAPYEKGCQANLTRNFHPISPNRVPVAQPPAFPPTEFVTTPKNREFATQTPITKAVEGAAEVAAEVVKTEVAVVVKTEVVKTEVVKTEVVKTEIEEKTRQRHRHWCTKCHQKRIGPTKDICQLCDWQISRSSKTKLNKQGAIRQKKAKEAAAAAKVAAKVAAK